MIFFRKGEQAVHCGSRGLLSGASHSHAQGPPSSKGIHPSRRTHGRTEHAGVAPPAALPVRTFL
eukprot:3770784-Amphidinium_carterae.4